MTPVQIDDWALTLSTGALLAIGGWKMLVAKRDYDRDQEALNTRCAKCQAAVDICVTKETLALTLNPILKEQEHRKGSVDLLGRTVAETNRHLQRLELHIVAIAAKLGVELAAPQDHG